MVAEDQADPLDRVEPGVEEGADLEGAEVRPVDAGDPGDHRVDELVVRIQPEVGDDPLGVRARVVPEEAETPTPTAARLRR